MTNDGKQILGMLAVCAMMIASATTLAYFGSKWVSPWLHGCDMMCSEFCETLKHR